MNEIVKPRMSMRKKVLSSIAVLALTGVMGVGATMSALTDQSTTDVKVTAGTIDLTAGGSKEMVLNLNIDNWYPGASSVGNEIDLKNSGTLPLQVTLATTHNGGVTGLSNRLTTTIKNGTATVSAAGTKMNAATFDAPILIEPGATAHLTVDAVWDTGSDDDNEWAGRADEVTYTFNAVNVAP